MPQILIIADDLSGAADCGMACATSGLSTVVMLGDVCEFESDVLAVDADTRCLAPDNAARTTARLMRRFMSNPGQIVFKKLDSTLRGNIGPELAAVIETQRNATSERHVVAVFAPAFPANGRVTSKGRQLLNGKPLEETEIWRREGKQGSSHIPAILESAGMRSTLLELDKIRSSNGSLPSAMRKLAEAVDVLVCDAETNQDLRAIADATAALGRGTVWAGSAGLAYQLPKALGLFSTKPAMTARPSATGPTLIVIGSASATSRAQAHALTLSSEVTAITIPPSELLDSSKRKRHELRLTEALRTGRDIAISLDAEDMVTTDGRLFSSALAKMLAPHAAEVGALVATGGETARAILQAWGITGLRLVKELEPGVPFSIAENWSRPLPVLTKAGDFGNPRTLLHCQQFFRGLDRQGKTP